MVHITVTKSHGKRNSADDLCLYTVFNNLIQNTYGVKKAQPSKVESYLEVNT